MMEGITAWPLSRLFRCIPWGDREVGKRVIRREKRRGERVENTASDEELVRPISPTFEMSDD